MGAIHTHARGGRDASDSMVLQVEELGVSYFLKSGAVPAVPEVSLAIRRGESVGLVGESGCGKTTVAMAVMRYLGRSGRIVRGRVRLEGRDMAALSGAELRRIRGSKMAMVYQEPMSALNPCMQVGFQLMEVPMVHEGTSRKDAHARAVEILRDVNMPDPEAVMRRYPHQLSGGQQQRVVIAMAFLSNPSLLLLDEPTTALDVTVEASVVDLIAELRHRYGTSLLYISHNLGLIVRVCDRVCVMYSGEVVEEGTIHEVFEHTRHPYTRGLLECIPHLDADKRLRPLVPIPGQLALPHERPPGCAFGPRCRHFEAGRCDRGEIEMESLPDSETHRVRCRRWREIEHRRPPPALAARDHEALPEPALRVERLDKVYEQRDMSLKAVLSGTTKRYIRANEQLTFNARRGHTLAIVGESGCGKSTFARVLTGLDTATGGEIDFHGESIAMIPVTRRRPELIAAVQMVFQNPDGTLNPSHSVGSAIGRTIRKLGVANHRREVSERVGDLLEMVRLPRAFARRKPRQLSGGQKQRIAVARAFAGHPAMVIADEPVSALDVSVQAAIINLLTEVQNRHRTTMLFISHDLGVVRYLSDSIVVMYLGQVMESGSAEEVLEPPYHPYTEALLSAVSVPDPRVEQKRIRLEGEIPSAFDPPPGCRFATRCPRRIGGTCDTEPPPEQETGSGHRIRCHIPIEALREVEPVIGVASRRPENRRG